MSLITVTGHIRDIDGQIPDSGTLTFTLDGMMIRPDNVIIPAKFETCDLGGSPPDGSFSILLNSTTDCYPNNRSYSVGFQGFIDQRSVSQALGSIQLSPSSPPVTVDLGQLLISGFSGGSVTPTLQGPDVALTLRETDQALPTGLWRVRVNGDVLSIEKNTAAAGDFSTKATFFTINIGGHIQVEGVTSTGAAGTGKFVFDTSPTLITPALGVAAATRLGAGVAADALMALLASGAGNNFIAKIQNTSGTGTGLTTAGALFVYTHVGAASSGIYGLADNGGCAATFEGTGPNTALCVNGDVILNGTGAAIAANATSGFVYIPICAGTPTGTPAKAPTGALPLIYDSTNHKLYVHDGTWKSVTLS